MILRGCSDFKDFLKDFYDFDFVFQILMDL